MTEGTAENWGGTLTEQLHKRLLLPVNEVEKKFARVDDERDERYPGIALVMMDGRDPLPVRLCIYYKDNEFWRCFGPHPTFGFKQTPLPDRHLAEAEESLRPEIERSLRTAFESEDSFKDDAIGRERGRRLERLRNIYLELEMSTTKWSSYEPMSFHRRPLHRCWEPFGGPVAYSIQSELGSDGHYRGFAEGHVFPKGTPIFTIGEGGPTVMEVPVASSIDRVYELKAPRAWGDGNEESYHEADIPALRTHYVLHVDYDSLPKELLVAANDVTGLSEHEFDMEVVSYEHKMESAAAAPFDELSDIHGRLDVWRRYQRGREQREVLAGRLERTEKLIGDYEKTLVRLPTPVAVAFGLMALMACIFLPTTTYRILSVIICVGLYFSVLKFCQSKIKEWISKHRSNIDKFKPQLVDDYPMHTNIAS